MNYLKEKTILIVEDENSAEKLLSIYLKQFCKEIKYAKNGLEAVNRCIEDPGIDLILMDIKMPVMCGYEAVEKIRAFNKEVVIIAQTAFALDEDRERAIEVGCNDYIKKPIFKDDLIKLISKYFQVENESLVC